MLSANLCLYTDESLMLADIRLWSRAERTRARWAKKVRMLSLAISRSVIQKLTMLGEWLNEQVSKNSV